MAEPNSSTCSPWATEDDLCRPCFGCQDFPDGMMDRMLQMASDLLFELSGRQYPGECSSTVRPCSRPRGDWGPRHSGSTPSCGCVSMATCGCPRPSEVILGAGPIVSVETVMVDGVELDPSLYRVDDYTKLVRLRDADGKYASWPCCQDILLEDTEPNTFSVTYTYGRNPPLTGIHVAGILACEFALACNPLEGAECRLPRRVQSLVRQGVSMVMIDPMEFLAAGRLGIPEVDFFITTYNKYGLRRTAAVLSPDFPQRVRRVGT